jgi:sugar O-acyltransferase (sialic acid O-acetyltransferase NeuD family)
MRKRIVIFGVGQWAELAHFYFTHDSPHEVVAFTLDREYLEQERFHDLPVVPFEDVEERYPPTEVSLFVPISFKRMSHARAERVEDAKAKGYELVSYVSSKATTFPDFACGENCFILEDNTIQPYVTIGRNVVMWSGNHIGHHTLIEDHVMITSQVVISGACRIGEHSFFGVNATVRDETVIGRETIVGAGTAIMADTEPFSVYKVKGTEPAGFRSDQLRSLSHKSGG